MSSHQFFSSSLHPSSEQQRPALSMAQEEARPATVNLPPRVRGARRGIVQIQVEEVVWFANSKDFSVRRPPTSLDQGTTLVRLRWWGEQGEGLVWKPVCARMDTDGNLTYSTNPAEQKSRARASVLSHGTSTAEHEAITLNESSPIAYPVVVSPNTFTNYLNDAQWLVFEIYHFQETDPAAIHREFLKQVHRTSHANRALPQAKAPLGHIMFDLAPLTESISYGELEFTSSKNLPILVNGTPIGQVAVKVQSELSATLALGDAPRPDQASHLSQQPLQGSNLLNQSQALNDSFARSGLNAFGNASTSAAAATTGPNAAVPTSPLLSASHHAGFNSQQLPRSASHHPTQNDPFDISHLIAQSDEMSKHIAESVLGQPMNVEAYIQEKNQQREQQQQHAANGAENVNQLHHGNAFDEMPVGQRANGETKFDPSAPYAHLAGLSNPHAASGGHGRSFGTTAASTAAAPVAVASSAHHPSTTQHQLAASNRPFAQGPAFADFTPAPAHLFPHLLPQLPAVLNIPPPFPQVSPEFGMPRSVKYDPESFLDEGNLITLNLRIRRVQLAKSQSELLSSASSLGGRTQQPNLNHIANHVTLAGDTTAGVSELIQQAKKHHAQEKRNAAGGASNDNDGKNQFLVLHYHFFTDLLMGRSPALFSTKYDLSHPGFFHFSESTPRVFSKSFLSSLQDREVPVELYAYKRKPSWKDKKDRDTGKYVPQQPYQIQLARAQIPLAYLLTLPYRLPSSAKDGSQSWVLRFLQSHIGLNTSLPLLDPLNPSPEIIGSIEVCLSWGTANDMALLTQMEKSALQMQKIVRGFLSRRRIRRFKIARALEEEENLVAEEDAHTHVTQRTHQSANVVALDQASLPLSPGTTRTISFPLNLPPASPQSPTGPPAAPLSSPVPPSYPQSLRRSASPSPQSSPRRPDSAASSRRPSYHHLAQPHPLKDMATSPINSPSATRSQPRFHLNLPTQHYSTANSAQVSSRKEANNNNHAAPGASSTQATAGSSSNRHARAASSPAPSFHSTPSPSSFFPTDNFVPAPRVEDKADFVSYSFQSKTAGIPSSIVPPPTVVTKIGTPGTDKATRVRSFQETLLAIQKAREEVAAAQALASPSKPLVQSTPTSSPLKLVRLGSESKPQRLQQEQKEKIEAEEDEEAAHPITKVKFEEEIKYASPQRNRISSSSARHGVDISSPPKASSAAKAQQSAALLSPMSKRLAEAALEDELLRVEELSDVDVDEYEDEAFEKESPVVAPSTSPPSSSLSHLSLLPPSFDNPLDASVARQKLSQQMRELDELQKRMEWRLGGKPIEEFEKQQQQHHQSTHSRIQSPLKTTSSVATGSASTPRSSPAAPRELTSPSKSTSQSVHPSPGVQSHQSSPMHNNQASSPVVVSVINLDNTNFRAAARNQPLTPETPAPFLSPSPRSAPAPARSNTVLSPLKSNRFDALDALPVSPKPVSSLSSHESPRRPVSAKAPSPSHASTSLLPHTSASSNRAHHVESDHEDSDTDVSVSDLDDDDDELSDDLLDDEDSAAVDRDEEDLESQPEPSSSSGSKPRQWGLQFQANQVDVAVRYEAGLLASEAASRARQQIAEQAAARERLFPAGLKSESSGSSAATGLGSSSAASASNYHSVEPGSARYESYQRALASSSGASSFLSKFTPEELQRLERAARIMAEEEHD